MRSARRWWFAAIPLLCLGIAPALGEEPGCKEFQLQSYKNRYHSSEECWANEKRYKGATKHCCGVAFGDAGEVETEAEAGPDSAPVSGRSTIQAQPARKNPSGKLRTPPYVLSGDANSRCASKGPKSSDAYRSCFADLMGRLVLTNEPDIATQCISKTAFEQPKCALEIYDEILAERAANGDTSLAFDEERIYWCSDAGDENVYSTGYYTQPGEGCSPKASAKAAQLETLRRRLKYLRKLKASAESEERIAELDYQIKEVDIAIGRLMNQ